MARRCGAKHISKSKCSKTDGLGSLLEVSMSKNGTPLWREAHLQVKMCKAPQREYFWKFGCRKFPRRCDAKHICKSKCAKHLSDGVLFGSSDVANFHAAVARSTFASQNDKNMRSSGHFLNADVEKLSKNGTPLWRQAHWQVKMLKHLRFAALLEVPLCEFTN